MSGYLYLRPLVPILALATAGPEEACPAVGVRRTASAVDSAGGSTRGASLEP